MDISGPYLHSYICNRMFVCARTCKSARMFQVDSKCIRFLAFVSQDTRRNSDFFRHVDGLCVYLYICRYLDFSVWCCVKSLVICTFVEKCAYVGI